MSSDGTGVWPSLPYGEWKETYATLHMWTQIVGKIRLVRTPWINHSWHVTLYVTPRGLTTSTMAHGTRTFEIEFDFVDHRLVVAASDGATRELALAPRSVASFYDLLHTEPVGTHKVAVCTNISCWMRGGDELLDAFRSAAEGQEDMFVTGFECLGACDIAPMASIDERYFGPLESADAATAIEQLLAGGEVLPEKELEKRPLPGDAPPAPDAGASERGIR